MFFLVGAATPHGRILRKLHRLFEETQQAVDYGDLCAAIDLFYEGYHLLLRMPAYVQCTPAAPIFNRYIDRANELNFKIRNGYVTLHDFREFLSPLSNVVSSVCGPYGNAVTRAIDGGFNAVFDDINGMANGLCVAVNELSQGDIFGAIAGGIGNVINGKLNAIGSLLNGLRGFLG